MIIYALFVEILIYKYIQIPSEFGSSLRFDYIASFTCNISIRMRAVSIAICLHCEDHYVSLQFHLTSHLFHFILNSFF